jgi:hypothetical protein
MGPFSIEFLPSAVIGIMHIVERCPSMDFGQIILDRRLTFGRPIG